MAESNSIQSQTTKLLYFNVYALKQIVRGYCS